MLNSILAHYSNDHKLLLGVALKLPHGFDRVDVFVKRACVCERVCECVFWDVVAVLSANDKPSGGAAERRDVFICACWFVVVLLRAFLSASSYFLRNGQLTSFALWLCGIFALTQLKHLHSMLALVSLLL